MNDLQKSIKSNSNTKKLSNKQLNMNVLKEQMYNSTEQLEIPQVVTNTLATFNTNSSINNTGNALSPEAFEIFKSGISSGISKDLLVDLIKFELHKDFDDSLELAYKYRFELEEIIKIMNKTDNKTVKLSLLPLFEKNLEYLDYEIKLITNKIQKIDNEKDKGLLKFRLRSEEMLFVIYKTIDDLREYFIKKISNCSANFGK